MTSDMTIPITRDIDKNLPITETSSEDTTTCPTPQKFNQVSSNSNVLVLGEPGESSSLSDKYLFVISEYNRLVACYNTLRQKYKDCKKKLLDNHGVTENGLNMTNNNTCTDKSIPMNNKQMEIDRESLHIQSITSSTTEDPLKLVEILSRENEILKETIRQNEGIYDGNIEKLTNENNILKKDISKLKYDNNSYSLQISNLSEELTNIRLKIYRENSKIDSFVQTENLDIFNKSFDNDKSSIPLDINDNNPSIMGQDNTGNNISHGCVSTDLNENIHKKSANFNENDNIHKESDNFDNIHKEDLFDIKSSILLKICHSLFSIHKWYILSAWIKEKAELSLRELVNFKTSLKVFFQMLNIDLSRDSNLSPTELFFILFMEMDRLLDIDFVSRIIYTLDNIRSRYISILSKKAHIVVCELLEIFSSCRDHNIPCGRDKKRLILYTWFEQSSMTMEDRSKGEIQCHRNRAEKCQDFIISSPTSTSHNMTIKTSHNIPMNTSHNIPMNTSHNITMNTNHNALVNNTMPLHIPHREDNVSSINIYTPPPDETTTHIPYSIDEDFEQYNKILLSRIHLLLEENFQLEKANRSLSSNLNKESILKNKYENRIRKCREKLKNLSLKYDEDVKSLSDQIEAFSNHFSQFVIDRDNFNFSVDEYFSRVSVLCSRCGASNRILSIAPLKEGVDDIGGFGQCEKCRFVLLRK